MDELFLKMHEEAMELQKANIELGCMITQLADAIHDVEVQRANNNYMDRKDVVEASIECSLIKRIIGMMPDICEDAQKILKEREMENAE